jgi:hypothetical protein
MTERYSSSLFSSLEMFCLSELSIISNLSSTTTQEEILSRNSVFSSLDFIENFSSDFKNKKKKK